MKLVKPSRIALIATCVAVALTVAGIAVAVTSGNSGNQGVAEINTHDYKSEHKVGFSVVHLQGDTVDNQNAAYAESSGCTHCNATAIAVQVVLVQSNSVTTVAPQNVAFSVNQQCSFCTSTGLAYQYAISTDGNVHFSADGNQQLADLRQQIDDRASSITDDPAALRAAVDPLVHQMWSVVDTEMMHSGAKYNASPYEDFQFDKTQGDGSPSPSPTSSESPPAAPSATPSDTAGPPVDTATPCPAPAGSQASSPTACPSETPQPSSTPTVEQSSAGTPKPADSSTPASETPAPTASSSP